MADKYSPIDCNCQSADDENYYDQRKPLMKTIMRRKKFFYENNYDEKTLFYETNYDERKPLMKTSMSMMIKTFYENN